MPIDTITFFYTALAGFMTVWTFRYFTNRTGGYSEFEWFGLSVFWGLIVLGIFNQIPGSPEKSRILENPFSAGLLLSFFGIFLGYAASRISRLGWFAQILDMLGRDGRDKVGNLF